MRLAYVAVAMLALAQASGALAEGQQQAQGQSTAQPPSSDELVCKKLVVTGSRLASHKYCATRAQWAQGQLQDRQEVERVQASPCVLTHNGGNGKPGC